MWNVVFRPEARRDIVKATKWYMNQNRRAGESFSRAVDAAVESVRENPFLYPIITRQTRRAPVPGFPYGLHYRIADDHVVTTACVHFRRYPRHWRAN